MLLNDSHFVSMNECVVFNEFVSLKHKKHDQKINDITRLTSPMSPRWNALFTLTAADRKAVTKKKKH